MTVPDDAPAQTGGAQGPAGGGTNAGARGSGGDQGSTGDSTRRPGAHAESDRLDPRALAAVGATVVFWASAFPGIKAALVAYTPGEIALLRFLVASLVLGVYAVAVRMPGPRLSDVPAITGLGLLGVPGPPFVGPRDSPRPFLGKKSIEPGTTCEVPLEGGL